MSKRGRKGSQDFHIVPATREARLAPPSTLSDAERYVWLGAIQTDVVDNSPVGTTNPGG